VEGDRAQEWLLWCLGSALFANIVTSFGINYSVHLMMFVFALLVCISVATFEGKQATVRRAKLSPKEQLVSAPAAEATYMPLDEARQGTWRGLLEAQKGSLL